MTHQLTTLNDLLNVLKSQEADLPLVFATVDGEIGGGYHVTELKQASITSIDCGGNIEDWRETHVQLLDGKTGDHMSAGKFAAIAETSMTKLHHLGDEPLFFEFALKNAGLRRFQVSSLRPDAAKLSVLLSEGHAMCKPAAASGVSANSTGCCGASKTASGCCA